MRELLGHFITWVGFNLVVTGIRIWTRCDDPTAVRRAASGFRAAATQVERTGTWRFHA